MADEDRAVPKPPPASRKPANPSTPSVQNPNSSDGRDDPRAGETR